MNNIFEPLTLASGSHEAGSGQGCAMNVISWENGDKVITDYPACSDKYLATVVQHANDTLAGPDGILSPANSIIALDLGHATVGTTNHSLSQLELKVVYIRCTAFAARKTLHLDTTGMELATILAAEKWADDPTEENRILAAYAAQEGSFYPNAAYAASEKTNTHRAVESVHYRSASLLTNGLDRNESNQIRVSLAWELINLFKTLTGTTSPAIDETVVAYAVAKMRVTA